MMIALCMLSSHFNIELDTSRPMEAKRNPLPVPYCFVKFHNRKD